ncbi:MAG: HIT domain-containing protein [Methylococcales bacterium]|nr:HIT domain-containing protein [Methylococcales bacterium]
MSFQLHPRLQQDCISIGHFELCQLLMMNDSHYPWFILVPEIADVSELYQLNKAQRSLLMEESCYLAEHLAVLFNADKMNVANIGNMVSQLHIHHIVRYQTDSAWPAPVWGKFPAVPYTETQITAQLNRLKTRLAANYLA